MFVVVVGSGGDGVKSFRVKLNLGYGMLTCG